MAERLTPLQQQEVDLALCRLTAAGVDLIRGHKLNYLQMREIRLGLERGMSIEQVKPVARRWIDHADMKELLAAIEAGKDVQIPRRPPKVIPLIVTVFLWKWIYNPQYGLLNQFLKLIGLGKYTTGWITNSSTALYAVTFTSIWKAIPGVFILYLAGLQSVPKEMEEAAVLDGAGRMQVIRYVVLPSLRRVTTIIYVLQFIDVFRVFDLVYAMTNGGPGYYTTEMILTYGYKTTFTNSNAGYGMSITTVLICFVSLVSVLQLRLASKRYDD